MVTRKSKSEIAKMRAAGRVVAEVLGLVETELRPGVSTATLDRLAERHIRAAGMTPSFIGYIGNRRYNTRDPHAFPATLCISIDDEIVHGIPGERVIGRGQLVSIDVGAINDGWHADAARTFIVGDVPAAARDLVDATHLALMAGIAAAQAGGRLGDIGAAVEEIGRAGGYGIIDQFAGHGIGTSMHEDPSVPNLGRARSGLVLASGLCLAIEPMFTLGTSAVTIDDDRWTVRTQDGSLAAHFEHTIVVTDEGPEVLTVV